MMMAAGKHRIHRTDEVAEVVGSSNQPGAGQVDLPLAE